MSAPLSTLSAFLSTVALALYCGRFGSQASFVCGPVLFSLFPLGRVWARMLYMAVMRKEMVVRNGRAPRLSWLATAEARRCIIPKVVGRNGR